MSPRPSVDTITPSSPSPPTPPPTPPPTTAERASLAKGKQRELNPGYDDFRDPELSPEPAAYPPTTDDAADTRRIEENLRRWDAVERQRRKSARESMLPTQSLVGEVTRTASLLWSAKRPRHRNDTSLGNHVALQSEENINSVALDDLNATPTPSPSPSPSPSPTPQRRDSSDPHNPFANPSESLSPFADPGSLNGSPSSALLANQSPDASASPMPRGPPGPPMPLGLPPPRTPPPINTAPGPTSPLSHSESAPHVIPEQEPQESRWWHDWLCGCSEGPDRGGDYQAGRTNPFE